MALTDTSLPRRLPFMEQFEGLDTSANGSVPLAIALLILAGDSVGNFCCPNLFPELQTAGGGGQPPVRSRSTAALNRAGRSVGSVDQNPYELHRTHGSRPVGNPALLRS